MQTPKKFFEKIPSKDIQFFFSYCKKENIEPEYKTSFFENLIEKMKNFRDSLKKERERKTIPKRVSNFATNWKGDNSYIINEISIPSKYEGELTRLIRICKAISLNIYLNQPIYKNDEENEQTNISYKKYTPAQKIIYGIIEKDEILLKKYGEDKLNSLDLRKIGKRYTEIMGGEYKQHSLENNIRTQIRKMMDTDRNLEKIKKELQSKTNK